MIPLFLQDELEVRLNNLFLGKTFTNPNNEEVPLNIFKQHLPEKSSDDLSLYPYVIIQLSEGEQIDENQTPSTSILFVIGVFDDQNTYQGYRDVANIIQSIYEDLKKKPLVRNQFELTFPVRWRIHDEDVFPYYFGGIETSWKTPNVLRSDVEALI